MISACTILAGVRSARARYANAIYDIINYAHSRMTIKKKSYKKKNTELEKLSAQCRIFIVIAGALLNERRVK